MGAAIGGLLADRFRVSWVSAGRGPASRRRAEEAGLIEVADLAALARCDVLVSVCPPSAALDVAGSVAATGFAGTYLDANAISPRHAAEIAEILPRATVVDGGIVGPPPRTAGTTRLYLSGPAAAVADLFDGTVLRVVVLDGPVGRASALKLAFASYNKLTYALAAQAHALAERHGVGVELRELAADVLPDTPFGAPGGITSAGRRAWRWEGEMAEIAAACAETGLAPDLVAAAQAVFARWREHRDDDSVDLAGLLRALAGPPS